MCSVFPNSLLRHTIVLSLSIKAWEKSLLITRCIGKHIFTLHCLILLISFAFSNIFVILVTFQSSLCSACVRISSSWSYNTWSHCESRCILCFYPQHHPLCHLTKKLDYLNSRGQPLKLVSWSLFSDRTVSSENKQTWYPFSHLKVEAEDSRSKSKVRILFENT